MFNWLRDFLDALLGRSAAPKPAISEPIFAIGEAQIEQEARLGVRPTGFAALAFRNVSSGMFHRLEQEIQELVRIGAEATGTRVQMETDRFNYMWLLLYDDDFEDLVATMHLASSTLEEHDFGRTLLAAAFQFADERERRFYWLYNFKRGLYYPFAPQPNRTRDSVLEMRLNGLMRDYLPLEGDHARWYPLWDIPGDPSSQPQLPNL
ncbi:MAG: hypothetical protein KDD73_11895 [Anaerolineales bacterium]|nr:hypothetical protein [Anaerolineales bacterium]MCB9126663.1 hypothetical protein [Ardenticatenales bacterium]MCB9171797.1 hypothetical protein [Ardenticatenales bacterium]